MSINLLFCWLLHNKYSFYRVWKQVHAACLEKSEFRLAQILKLDAQPVKDPEQFPPSSQRRQLLADGLRDRQRSDTAVDEGS